MGQNQYKHIEPPQLAVIEAAREGDPEAINRILHYYDGYIDKLCTRTLYDKKGRPRRRVDEFMKSRLQNKLIYAIVSKDWAARRERKP